MENHSCLQNFDEEDLISFLDREKILRIKNIKDSCLRIFSTDRIQDELNTELSEVTISSYTWLTEGVECEILKLGDKQWKKGKIKVQIAVNFIPDEDLKPSSELDSFRDIDDECWPPPDPAT